MTGQELMQRAKRPLSFMGVGSFMTVVNTVVLFGLVSGIGVLPVLANLLRSAATTQLHFYLHKRFTWKGDHATSLWQQWYRYHLMKVGNTVLGQLAFVALTVWLSSPYIPAYLVCNFGLGALNLLMADKMIFTSQQRSSEGEAPA